MMINDNGINREMTEQETAAHALWVGQQKAEFIALAKAAADRATARQSVLDRLGITADEAALLLG